MFTINLHGKKSIYEQIRDQIMRFIGLGIIAPNDKMPSVRQLAYELNINPNTVAKAYQELEKSGYIYILPKKGAFVADRHEKNDPFLSFRQVIDELKNEGYQSEELIEIINDMYGG